MPDYRIDVPVCSDGWIRDHRTVLEKLHSINADPTHDVVWFKIAEGVSMIETGVIDMIQQWQKESGFPVQRIEVECGNTVEKIPFYNCRRGVNMNFFTQALEYGHKVTTNHHAAKFGLFVGRVTVERMCIMYHMHHEHNNDCLISLLQDVPVPFRTFHQVSWSDIKPCTRNLARWYDHYDKDTVIQWIETNRPASLDNRRLDDQYNGSNVAHRSLLDFYDRFSIEIIPETMLYGDTFWPTEKTARPIAAAKPFLLFGSRGHLKYLRWLGFETYSSIWDESYDDLEGLDRWLAMRKVVLDLSMQNDKQWLSTVQHANEIANKNADYFYANFPLTDWTRWEKNLGRLEQPC